ncbi:Uncaracterized surface protein containing fasciclin (FAS1) repeats [Marivirga sericea]|uniref:Uncaracterized surface protein containing fasciclin (FAS1) repeats n=1 Tax=Marivirga sericea TaxID=1028 RepID=A0A1X7LAE7_9BACT|nr:fasciclin domain-containing protein [Marivirga sericea]SMG50811.1 Uncaracterized surface protein containing fasciclin (FAS1) repeats [Marivirga sericea]
MKNLLKYTSLLFAGLLLVTTSCIDEDYDDSSDVGISDKDLLINVLNDENQSGELSNLLTLVEANGLTGALTSRRTQDQITVFAPTNNAFEILAAQLGYDSVEDLLADDDVDLVEILETHIAVANLSLDQIENGNFRSITTLSGINIPIARNTGEVVINANEDLEILRSNSEGNGTVHVISRVILPIRFNIEFSADFGADFDACNAVVDNWNVVNVELEGGSGWGCTGFGFEGQGIQANGFSDGAQIVDSWIISPSLQSNDVILNTLKFKYASRFDGPSPEVWVIAEEDYDAEAAFDMEAWTNLEVNFPPPASENNVFSDLSVSIPSDFNSGSYRFAFRYLSGAGATRVTIDNIQVGEE